MLNKFVFKIVEMKNCCTTLEVKNPGNGDLDQHKKLYGTYTKSSDANGRAVYTSEDGKWGVWWCGQYWGFNKINKQGKSKKLNFRVIGTFQKFCLNMKK